MLIGESNKVRRHCFVLVEDVPNESPYLMCDVGSGVADVAVHLPHDPDVLVTIQQRVLFVLFGASSSVRSLVGFQASMRQDDNKALGVLVGSRYRNHLLCDELRQFRWGARLSACTIEYVRNISWTCLPQLNKGCGGSQLPPRHELSPLLLV